MTRRDAYDAPCGNGTCEVFAIEGDVWCEAHETPPVRILLDFFGSIADDLLAEAEMATRADADPA